MTTIGVVKKYNKYGNIDERHVIVEDLTGPGSDVSVAAGSTANLTFNIASESPRDIQYAGVESISGLPADILIQSITFDKTAKTLTIRVYNKSTAAITIAAGSVTVRVVSIS